MYQDLLAARHGHRSVIYKEAGINALLHVGGNDASKTPMHIESKGYTYKQKYSSPASQTRLFISLFDGLVYDSNVLIRVWRTILHSAEIPLNGK